MTDRIVRPGLDVTDPIVRPALGFKRALFIDRDRTVQIARAIQNVFCTVRVRDFLTKPNYYLVANRNVGMHVHMYVRDICMYVCT